MSPKQLYFSILGFLITIVVIVGGLFLLNQQQHRLAITNLLVDLYNGAGKEMVASAKAIEVDGFSAWLADSVNEELLQAVRDSGEDFLYCPSLSGNSFVMAWVKNNKRLTAGKTECWSTSRGKLMVNLECNNTLACVRSN